MDRGITKVFSEIKKNKLHDISFKNKNYFNKRKKLSLPESNI
jgi:hypothetical protein